MLHHPSDDERVNNWASCQLPTTDLSLWSFTHYFHIFFLFLFFFLSHTCIKDKKGEIKLINSNIQIQLPVRGCLQWARGPGKRSPALLHRDRQQKLHHGVMRSVVKTRISALDPPNWWENFVKITAPITLTQEKLFFRTFDLLENTFCSLAKNDPSKLASPCVCAS